MRPRSPPATPTSLNRLIHDADVGFAPTWTAIVCSIGYAAFPRLPRVGLHHLSPQSGRVVISSDTPFPDRTPPARQCLARSWAENRGLLGRCRISPCPRPRTVHAAFTAHGANKQIPLNWRFKGVGAGGPLEHCAPSENEWLWSGWRPAHTHVLMCMGGPPRRPGSDYRTRSPSCPGPWICVTAACKRVFSTTFI